MLIDLLVTIQKELIMTTQTYDITFNGRSYFEAEEILKNPTLAQIARHLGVTEGGLEVQADNEWDAFTKMFGFQPDADDFPEGVETGWYQINGCMTTNASAVTKKNSYCIRPESSW
jgi:hypothetical protein